MTDIEMYIDMLERANIKYFKMSYGSGMGKYREELTDVDIRANNNIDISFTFKSDGSLDSAVVEGIPYSE